MNWIHSQRLLEGRALLMLGSQRRALSTAISGLTGKTGLWPFAPRYLLPGTEGMGTIVRGLIVPTTAILRACGHAFFPRLAPELGTDGFHSVSHKRRSHRRR